VGKPLAEVVRGIYRELLIVSFLALLECVGSCWGSLTDTLQLSNWHRKMYNTNIYMPNKGESLTHGNRDGANETQEEHHDQRNEVRLKEEKLF
jgi:hypothetical protein